MLNFVQAPSTSNGGSPLELQIQEGNVVTILRGDPRTWNNEQLKTSTGENTTNSMCHVERCRVQDIITTSQQNTVPRGETIRGGKSAFGAS